MGESSEQHRPAQETLGYSKRVFRIPRGFGELGKEPMPGLSDLFPQIKAFNSHNKKVLKLFQDNTYEIIRGGSFNSQNQLELTISSEEQRSTRERDSEIANAVGIGMPRLYSPQEVVQSSRAVVAKDPAVEAGESKWLLESDEQKVRFIAWTLMSQNIALFVHKYGIDGARTEIARVFQKIHEGNFSDPLIHNQEGLSKFVFEECIDTPGDFATSFRIVVDAFGNIHYGQIARSEEEKGKIITSPLVQADSPELVLRPGIHTKLLLENPDSPFYIAPKKFVSNVIAGGMRIFLNGQAVYDPVTRRILEDLEIDPDHPQIPSELLEPSMAIGRQFRQYAPFVGADFLKGKNGEYSLLELNKRPIIIPQAIGLPDSKSSADCDLELMKRIITSSPYHAL